MRISHGKHFLLFSFYQGKLSKFELILNKGFHKQFFIAFFIGLCRGLFEFAVLDIRLFIMRLKNKFSTLVVVVNFFF